MSKSGERDGENPSLFKMYTIPVYDSGEFSYEHWNWRMVGPVVVAGEDDQVFFAVQCFQVVQKGIALFKSAVLSAVDAQAH